MEKKLGELLEITRTIVCDMTASDPAFDVMISKRIDLAQAAYKETRLRWHTLCDIMWSAVMLNPDVKLEQVLEAMKVMGWKAEVSYEVK